MNRGLMGCVLGLVIISGGAICSPNQDGDQSAPGQGKLAEKQVLLYELGLRLVDQEQVAKECLAYDKVTRVFSTIRYASIAVLTFSAGINFYNWYSQIPGRSDRERISALEAGMKLVTKQTTGKEEPTGWISSITSFAKGIFVGVPTTLGSTLVSGAAVGLLTSTMPISELAKSEPSYKWFVGYKTGFMSECDNLYIYIDRQAVHEILCIETVRLVSDVEKILGYIAYQVKKLKKSSSMAAKVLESRSAQLTAMTNQLVDLVAQKEYEQVVLALQLLKAFVSEGLPAGILV